MLYICEYIYICIYIIYMYYIFIYVFVWDSLHARMNRHYDAWNYKKKKYKKIKAYWKFLKDPQIENSC